MNTIKVDENCNGCMNCVKSCWVDVLRWDEQRERPIAAYPEDCVDCNYCEISCSNGAIHVTADYAKPWPNIYS